MPVTNHAITLLINGVDRTSYLIKDSIYARLSVGNKSDVAEFKLKNFNPTEHEQVQIKVNGTSIFGGYIITKKAEAIGVAPKTIIWSCECKDWSFITDRITLTASYTGVGDSDVVDALFSAYTTGFDSSTYVTPIDNDLDITFTEISLRDALDNLASRSGANWFIDASKAVHWFLPTNPDLAAFNIDTENPNNSTTFDILRNSLDYSVDASSIVNRIIINGGTKSSGTKVTDTFTGNGITNTFGETTQTVDSVLYVDFTDTNNNHYVTYGSFIGYAPDDKLVSEGGSYQVVIGASRTRLKCEGALGAVPKDVSTITIVYYYKEGINLTVDDVDSQSVYGIFSQSITNKEFTDEDQAEEIAQSIFDQYARGRESISFSITRYGLLPGTLIDITIPDIDIGSTAGSKLLVLENGDALLLESSDYILLQSDAVAQTFLVQEIAYTCTVTATNNFMIVAQVTAGKYVRNIIDSLSSLSELRTNAGASTQEASQTRLSNISSNLGEVVIGRAVFTDGGNARFNWGTPNGATGAVIGLEDKAGTAYGAVYIYDQGTVKAKLGRLDDVPAIGTVQPSGWGLYTQNGFFSGIVAASQLIGGTVTGQQINGGTIQGGLITGGVIQGGQIAGALIEGNTIIGGTIATSTPPINSSNPGVYIDSTGLYGYGSAGLTFRLASDPAIKPYFSSGTITNVVYEITTAAVLRTGTSNPRIQIDNSGMFAYDSGGVLRFSVDVSTGRLTASQGTFTGTVSASAITGGTISGGLITGQTIQSGNIVGNSITGGSIYSTTINAVTMTSSNLTSGTITGVVINGNQITGGTITGGLISGGTVTGALVSGGTVNAGSGSVILSSAGIQLTNSPSITVNPSFLQWVSGGTVTAFTGGYLTGSSQTMITSVGVHGSFDGYTSQKARSTTSGVYTEVGQGPFYFNIRTNSETWLDIDQYRIEINKSIRPTGSSFTLGSNGGKSFRYLYLNDGAGNDYSLTVSSGTLLLQPA